MLNAIVDAALRYKVLVIVAFGVLVGLGIMAFRQVPVDAFPDVTPAQVNIYTESPGVAAEDIERLLTVPIEGAMAGLANVEVVRSVSLFGLSYVGVYFKDDVDIYFARRLVGEKLQEVKERLPQGYGEPVLGPNSSGLGQVFWYTIEDADKKLSAMDLRTLQDLSRFPFTTKQDLRANYPFGMFAVPREQVARIHASSGTTGKPTVVGYTRQDIDHWSNLVARSIRAAGGRAGDLLHVAYGYGLFTGGLGAHYGAERLGCTVIPVSGGQTEKQVQLIQDFKPRIIMVTPSYMQVIIEEFIRQGQDPRASSLEIGIFGAEPWTEAMRTEIEGTSGMDAVDIYGLSEVMGPGVASECVESKDGPVVWEDHFYPEVIDPDTGAPVADGQEGELVFTSLTKEAFPVIRYRTRDLTRLLPPTSRAFRRMGKIVGRTDDMLIVRGVNVFPTAIREIVAEFAPTVSGPVSLTIPAGSNTGKVLRLKGKGVGGQGDQFVRLQVMLPETPDEDLKKFVKKWPKRDYSPSRPGG